MRKENFWQCMVIPSGEYGRIIFISQILFAQYHIFDIFELGLKNKEKGRKNN